MKNCYVQYVLGKAELIQVVLPLGNGVYGFAIVVEQLSTCVALLVVQNPQLQWCFSKIVRVQGKGKIGLGDNGQNGAGTQQQGPMRIGVVEGVVGRFEGKWLDKVLVKLVPIDNRRDGCFQGLLFLEKEKISI